VCPEDDEAVGPRLFGLADLLSEMIWSSVIACLERRNRHKGGISFSQTSKSEMLRL
jgi:hypothetical protein